jgi:hypothetical protein
MQIYLKIMRIPKNYNCFLLKLSKNKKGYHFWYPKKIKQRCHSITEHPLYGLMQVVDYRENLKSVLVISRLQRYVIPGTSPNSFSFLIDYIFELIDCH